MSFDHDLVTGVGDPVEDGIGDDRIREEPGPVADRPVGCQDHAFRAEAPVDDRIEAFG